MRESNESKGGVMRKFVIIIILAMVPSLLITLPASAMTVTAYIEASRDNTLFEDPAGALSSGAGPALFAGRTNQPMNSIRRGIIYFDVASALPANAVIKDASLMLYMTKANNINRVITLHRLLRDWGEGASVSSGGRGAPAEPGDATWLHTFYPDTFWNREGGHYVGRVSARLAVGDVIGYYASGSTKQMVQDIHRWLKRPGMNYGWMLKGEESVPQTVVPFASREHPDPDRVPLLEVIYKVPAE